AHSFAAGRTSRRGICGDPEAIRRFDGDDGSRLPVPRPVLRGVRKPDLTGCPEPRSKVARIPRQHPLEFLPGKPATKPALAVLFGSLDESCTKSPVQLIVPICRWLPLRAHAHSLE